MAKKRSKKNKRSLKQGKQERVRVDSADVEEYNYHNPVMLRECCDNLVVDERGTYVDGTLGGGGHTAEIFNRLNREGHLYSFDADSVAIEHCKERFKEELQHEQSRLTLVHANFERACSIEEEQGITGITGLLLDLGVSSQQLDTGSIGLSYRVESQLDMRFSKHGPTALDIIAAEDQSALERLFRRYGEEPNARKIARRIVEIRRTAPIETTFQLRDLVCDLVPQPLHYKTLSRVFQALRIAVNDELGVLERTLTGVVDILKPGGRIVVLTYHSLEDRIVKHIFKDLCKTRIPDPDGIYSTTKEITPVCRAITPKPQLPTEEEIKRNPRARSAKLRVIEKV